ncbi:hypothetical protein DSO57_1007653 [Entomophthora muscae]|uniref:Uncharacterized protein n=1 Tax=Entomophthora muscae TaxID=34485 RepID=A0ACC2SKD1_9FUNG|nr:hypothetical protein DSO57_1007653 [Entomophthora muscae]
MPLGFHGRWLKFGVDVETSMNLWNIFLGAVAAGRVKRVVDGNTASPFKYPWVVAIFRYSVYKCSGTLLSSNRVITAAHCFAGARAELTHYEVHAHRHNISLAASEEDGEVFGVKKRWIHPDFDEETYYNDVAIIQINSTTAYRPSVILDTSLNHTEGAKYNIAGWGALAENQRSTSLLQEALVPINSHERCRQEYINAEEYNITSSHICAGGLNQTSDACHGDSGGPLFIQSLQGPVLVGVTSTGHYCGHESVPGVSILGESNTIDIYAHQ